MNNALSKLLDYRAQRKRNSLVDGAQQHDALLGQPQRMGDGDDELSWLQKVAPIIVGKPKDYINPDFAKGAAKELVAGTLGLPGDAGYLLGNAKGIQETVGENWDEGRPLFQGVADNMTDPRDYPLTSESIANNLGIGFSGSPEELRGRVWGGALLPSAAIKGAKNLRKLALESGYGSGPLPPMAQALVSQRGNINYMDMPSFAEAFGDAADPGFFKASEGFRKGPSQFLVNPSENEIRTFFSRADMKDGGVRTTKDGDGNLYMWNAKEGTHKQFHIGVEDKFDKDMNWNQEYWNNHTERLYPEFEATEIAARNNPGVPALDTFDKRMAWVKGKPGRKLELQGRPRNQPIPNEMVNFLSDEPISSAGAVSRQGAAASGAAKDKAPAANALADDHDFLVALRDAQMRSLSYNADLMGDVARVPDKTITGYKLASRKKSQPGELYPGMLEANTPAFSRGEWQPARNEALAASRKNVAHRPGMHFIETPTADPTSTKGLSRARKNALDRVWVEAQFPDDTSEAWQRAAELSGDTTGGIAGEIPWGGNYLWNRPGQPMRIAGAQNITREVPLEEIAAIETRAKTNALTENTLYGPEQSPASAQSAGALSAPETNFLRDRGGVARGADELGETPSQIPQDQPLVGLPTYATIAGEQVRVGPNVAIRRLAEQYARDSGVPYVPITTYKQVDKGRAKRINDAFSEMTHDPANHEVMGAYTAMIDETAEQYKAILNSGLKIEFIPEGAPDPYAASPRMAMSDVTENNHLWVYPTRTGFGQGGVNAADVADNPLLAETEFLISGQRALANDIFRAVHDYFGHIKEGNGFRWTGEENAWRSHASMYTPLARKAMTNETRGQNSWVNFGPHGEANRSALAADTIYADQKIGLLPDWVFEEGLADDLVQGAVRKVKPDPELAPKPMTQAQAKAAGYPRDQRWHPVSKNRLRRPLDQVERVVEDDGLGLMRPAVTISPEELQGGTLIPALGDPSDIGKNLLSVGGNALASPVRLEGGHGYTRQGDESVWASAEGKVSALNNKANEALEAGRDPYLVYVPMGHETLDFNTMMTDATYELMKGGELSKTARNKFDRLMRQKRNLWPGIDSDEARTMLDGNGEVRKAFMSIVGREEFRNLPGMPDVAELRYALTDPDLLDVPLGQGGQSIARASGTVVQDPKLPHSTYDRQMGGEYVGGFGKEGVPRDVMFPDFIKARRADRDDSGAGYDARSMELSLPTQEANQEWVDGMMAYLMSKGMTAAAAAAVLGAGTQGMQEEPTNALAGS